MAARRPPVRKPPATPSAAVPGPAPRPRRTPAPALHFEWLPQRPASFYALVIFGLAVLLYLNTLGNRYALDDGMIITENTYTQQGFGGIGKLLTTDSFEGVFGPNIDILAGGRWRPLALVTFAIEYEFTGQGPAAAPFSHLINVLLYALVCWVLFRWLIETVWPHKPDWAFFAALVFTIHPVHTEAVANLKGRDEILSLLFLLLTLLHASRALRRGAAFSPAAALCYLLALLSKENGITFLAILPLTFYFFHQKKAGEALRLTLPYFGVAVLYLAMRTGVIGLRFSGASTDVLNQPYILATTAQKYATIAYVQLRYLGLLVWPHPLAFDYGYQQIPYQNWTAPVVWASVLVHGGLIAVAVVGLPRRWAAAYGIWFYLASISIFSNLVFNLGGTLGERFLFQPSVGFALALAAVVGVGLSRLHEARLAKKLFLGLAVLLLVPSCFKVWARNPVWKNNETLFLTDVETVPMSAKAQKGAGEALLKMGRDDSTGQHNKALLERALMHYNRALELHPKFVDAWLDKGATLYMLGRYAECEAAWNQAEALSPHNSTLRKHYDILAMHFHSVAQRKFANRDTDSTLYYCQKAIRYERSTGKPWHLKATTLGMMQRIPEALAALDTALAYEPRNPQYWYDKGGIAYNGGDYTTAAAAMEQTLRLDPNFPQAAEGLRAARQRLQFPQP